MTKVITYGTYDLLHYGHIRLLERAKALGDYLIVGVTADDFDKTRGKINIRQSLMERVEAVLATGIADEVIVEEYEGQKIDDIQRYEVDIFTVGSDWAGQFDYLKEYCQVVYLDRTQGVSSTDLRAQQSTLGMGFVGESQMLLKYIRESRYVNGIEVTGFFTDDTQFASNHREHLTAFASYEELLRRSEAVYIASHPSKHYAQAKQALLAGKHVLCESPVALSAAECEELFLLAEQQGLIFMESIKTAFATAYNRLVLMLKSGKIGEVISVDATCTSQSNMDANGYLDVQKEWNSLCAWGPIAMLPIFQILGTDYRHKRISTRFIEKQEHFDGFTKVDFTYPGAVASVKIGKAVKSEGELVITGTKGYVYVPAPWWKTDYFEIRYENIEKNKRYFYSLEGEGIRYEFVAFVKSIEKRKSGAYIPRAVTGAICRVIEDFYSGKDVIEL